MKLFPFLNKNKTTAFKCDCCGTEYNETPLCFGSDYPDYYFSIPIEERKKRIELKESLCVVDEKHFFHRGRLTIPIKDYNEDLIFNVWTSISEDNFYKRMDLWEDENRVDEEPYFGWIQTLIPTYGETINIKSIAIEQKRGLIPEIKSIEENHNLTIDQENGINYKRAKEIVNLILKEQHRSK